MSQFCEDNYAGIDFLVWPCRTNRNFTKVSILQTVQRPNLQKPAVQHAQSWANYSRALHYYALSMKVSASRVHGKHKTGADSLYSYFPAPLGAVRRFRLGLGAPNAGCPLPRPDGLVGAQVLQGNLEALRKMRAILWLACRRTAD